MKGAKATSLRTQEAIARYGKAARHPLCLAALDLLRRDEELFKCTEEIELSEELVKRTKQMKENAQALFKAQTRYQVAVKLRSFYQEGRQWAVERFKCEYERVIRTGDAKACRALQRLRKRWIAGEAALKAGDHRTLETLNMLRKRVIEAKGQ